MAFENGFSLKSELADAGTKFGQLFGLNDIGKLLDHIEMSDTIGGLIDGIKLPDDTKEPEQKRELTPEEINENSGQPSRKPRSGRRVERFYPT